MALGEKGRSAVVMRAWRVRSFSVKLCLLVNLFDLFFAYLSSYHNEVIINDHGIRPRSI